MPQTKAYTAKRKLRLDCGHTVEAGKTFVATTIYSCQQEASWPLWILMACFRSIQQKQAVKPQQP
ncbi:MAG: hypothetical protein U0350_43270 [Caldilineaceae bacterium]